MPPDDVLGDAGTPVVLGTEDDEIDAQFFRTLENDVRDVVFGGVDEFSVDGDARCREGVDGVFFGPADLSASLGHLGNASHPDVLRAIDDGIAAVLAAGKAPGILATNPERARGYLAAGALFVAVGFDTTLLARGARSLAGDFGRSPPR